jgi:hypothetical protein
VRPDNELYDLDTFPPLLILDIYLKYLFRCWHNMTYFQPVKAVGGYDVRNDSFQNLLYRAWTGRGLVYTIYVKPKFRSFCILKYIWHYKEVCITKISVLMTSQVRRETTTVLGTMSFENTGRWTKSKSPVILSFIYHLHNVHNRSEPSTFISLTQVPLDLSRLTVSSSIMSRYRSNVGNINNCSRKNARRR